MDLKVEEQRSIKSDSVKGGAVVASLANQSHSQVDYTNAYMRTTAVTNVYKL